MPTPEVIQATGVAVATVLGAVLTAWQARTAAKLRDVESRLQVVEGERDNILALLRAAVRHIRDWMAWGMVHAPGIPPPPTPPELLDEV